jgi:hypothetical protein
MSVKLSAQWALGAYVGYVVILIVINLIGATVIFIGRKNSEVELQAA